MAAAFAKPEVSPQPPIEIRTEMPTGNFERTFSTVVNRGQAAGGSAALNASEGINARST